jgi:DNA-binding CsgD family transcriptional regulator
MAESHLKDIISPFLKKMASFNLTPKEIQIASLIKENKTTKEIANVVGIAQSSVEFHRHNIRRKLGIINEKTNLQAFLLSLT